MESVRHIAAFAPPLWSAVPFVLLLLAIAVFPLVRALESFWGRNRNKLLVSVVLSVPVLLYYLLGHPAVGTGPAAGAPETSGGLPVLGHMLSEAVLEQFVPFIVLLLGLYTVSGGIQIRGDLPATPGINTAFLGAGTLLASLIGTTGAAMLLIRPLLQTNAERRHVRHTVIFFIFLVCNIGGCLLPTGDPPLFLGYLKGVPFAWTLSLLWPWLLCAGVLLCVYYAWDLWAFAKESPADLAADRANVQPLRMSGKRNLVYLLMIVLAVVVLVPGKPLVGFGGVRISEYCREAAILAIAGLSLLTTPRGLRRSNRFTFAAIAEVAALFIGIFITMQAPIEILQARGPSLGLTQPWQYFWATGSLSSVLDNAPTYVVFFETANSLSPHGGAGTVALLGGQYIRADLLAAVSLGAVFMGANTYIGNGPNFMVKTIAQEHGVKMPSFFGYMIYSACILLPIFLALTVLSSIRGWR